jgi:hypothetical protein
LTVSACDPYRKILGRFQSILTVCPASTIIILQDIMVQSIMNRR